MTACMRWQQMTADRTEGATMENKDLDMLEPANKT